VEQKLFTQMSVIIYNKLIDKITKIQ